MIWRSRHSFGRWTDAAKNWPISYAIVATLAASPFGLHPPGKEAGLCIEPRRGLPTGPRAEQTSLSPLVVEASNTELVDLRHRRRNHLESLQRDQRKRRRRPSTSARHQLVWSLADIFEYKVDMSRDLHDGDKFHLLVERLQKPNGAIIVNKILGARLALSNSRNPLEAIHFDTPGSSTGQYYDASGMSLRAAFLRAPLVFRRISSVFGSRKHPIFGEWRNHTGTDYAAAEGTPVRAIGDGVVIFAGKKGGYGNMIDIRHRNGMISRYGHMRGFASGIRQGRASRWAALSAMLA